MAARVQHVVYILFAGQPPTGFQISLGWPPQCAVHGRVPPLKMVAKNISTPGISAQSQLQQAMLHVPDQLHTAPCCDCRGAAVCAYGSTERHKARVLSSAMYAHQPVNAHQYAAQGSHGSASMKNPKAWQVARNPCFQQLVALKCWLSD